MLEKAPALGGTWFYNRYPLCACDVPSHLYSFSFAQRRDWSRICSPRDEILRYVEVVAREHGVERALVTGTEVTACSWDEAVASGRFRAPTAGSWEADALIVATGQLHQPAIPRFRGGERFAGEAFHSSRWPEGFDPRGKRVAVVGTGASAIQFIPDLAPKARAAVRLPADPNWFLPRRNRAYPEWLRAVFKYVPESRRTGGVSSTGSPRRSPA